MLTYVQPVFRPPSEAQSLILQVTLGCSHNKCTFCVSFKKKPYRIKTQQELSDMIDDAVLEYPNPRKIFLADADAMSIPTELMLWTLQRLKAKFPRVQRISAYACPQNLLEKTPEELLLIRQTGLNMLYLGVESGSDTVLADVRKGVTADEMIAAGQRAVAAGYILSAMLISGLGGVENWEDHATGSARVVSAIQPHYLGLLSLTLRRASLIMKRIDAGELTCLTPWEVLRETRMFITHLELNQCTFRVTHVSNYFTLAGVMNRDKAQFLAQIDTWLKNPQVQAMPIDNHRSL
jgi:hypothetical protein